VPLGPAASCHQPVVSNRHTPVTATEISRLIRMCRCSLGNLHARRRAYVSLRACRVSEAVTVARVACRDRELCAERASTEQRTTFAEDIAVDFVNAEAAGECR
jgi:hypothetical protein